MRDRLPLTILLIAVTAASSLAAPPDPGRARGGQLASGRDGERTPVMAFFDDMEDGVNGWTHVDNTAQSGEKFHVDTYNAYSRGYSWWCGELNAAFSGGDGYGNNWTQMLELPAIDLSGTVYPMIEFSFRCDTEESYDLVYVQAESGGVYADLNDGWSGLHSWNDFSGYPVGPSTYDNPLNARFLFVSDGAFSDEDGGYDSNGGAFQVDNIRVYDYSDGTTLFLDDGEGGGLCVPGIPPASGDFWHITSRGCGAYSGSHCWWCGSDGDTSLVPANIDNSLTSPSIDLSGALTCTLRFLLNAQVPTDDADYWIEEITVDGGANWHMTGVWWGDFAECQSWALHGIEGIDISPYLPGNDFRFRLTMQTTDDGCGPGVTGGAGVMLDDVWVEDWTGSPVRRTTWGSIKAMYR